MNFSQLKDKKFNNSTELVACLINNNFVWRADKETEHLYILDKTNPERHLSKEFAIKEDKDGKLVLEKV